jgi:catechol 2,3-dioxygenase-like lactoylglutathione lyase family enzyme
VANVSRVGRVLVPVANQDDAIKFYTEKLGFSVTSDVPFGQGDRWVEVTPPEGGTSIALVPPQGDFQPGRPTGVGLESADIKALHADLKDKDVEVEDQVLGGDGTVPLLFFFRDNDGNHLMVAQPQ